MMIFKTYHNIYCIFSDGLYITACESVYQESVASINSRREHYTRARVCSDKMIMLLQGRLGAVRYREWLKMKMKKANSKAADTFSEQTCLMT